MAANPQEHHDNHAIHAPMRDSRSIASLLEHRLVRVYQVEGGQVWTAVEDLDEQERHCERYVGAYVIALNSYLYLAAVSDLDPGVCHL